MRKLTLVLLLGAFGFILSACTTGQVAKSKFACGGTSHLTAEFSPAVDGGQPQLASVNVCTGTNGSDRKFEYVISDQGREVKRISYGSTSTEATSALMVVGEVLKATSSNDAAVASAAVKALPEVLSAFVRLSSPLP